MPPSRIAKRRAAAKADASGRYTERRASLIKVAADVFREKGFPAASLDDIASKAGIDRASLYYYVSSKKELFYEVVKETVEANVLAAETIRDSSATPGDKLRKLLVELLTSYDEHPSLFVFLQEDMRKVAAARSKSGKELVELMRRFDEAAMGIVQQGVADGSFRSDIPPRISAYGILGMANWTHRWFSSGGALSGRDVGEAFAKLICGGLEAQKDR